MRRKLILATAIAMMTLSPALKAEAHNGAKDSTAQTAPRAQRQGRQRMDPAKIAQERAQRLTKQLGLTEEQGNKLQDLFKSEQAERQKTFEQLRGQNGRLTSEQRQALRKQRQEAEQQEDEKIKAILTSDQYAKYTKLKTEMQNRRGRGGRPGYGRGRGGRASFGGGTPGFGTGNGGADVPSFGDED